MASELLKRVYKATLTNAETVLLNGVDGHTYTILSITLCETAGAAETFEHTGRIVLEDEDHLCAATGSSAVVDVVVTYLDQTR